MYPKGAPSVLPLAAVTFSSSSSKFQAAPNKEETRDSQPEVGTLQPYPQYDTI